MDDWIYHATWLGNSAYTWIVAGIGALVGYIVVYGVARLVAARLKSMADRRPGNLALYLSAATVRATRGWVLLLLAIAIALHSLNFSTEIDDRMAWLVGEKGSVDGGLAWLIGVLIGIQIAFWVSTLIVAWLKRGAPDGSTRQGNAVIYGILVLFVELLVWVVLLLVILSSSGVKVGALIASLGIGGIAIALALKNVLEDLFASLSIGMDKPFEVGDFIIFGSEMGTITKVGIKTTRIKALSGEEMSINNSNLLQHLVHNLSRREERRINFGFRVPLDTPREKASQIAGLVNGIITSEDMVRLDRGHLLEIEQDGFRFEFVYYMLTPDYTPYCDTQQSINLKIMAELDALGVTFAWPTRLVHTVDGGTALAEM